MGALLNPSSISAIQDSTNLLSSHASALSLSALSDIRQLFLTHSDDKPSAPSIVSRPAARPPKTHLAAAQKLLFYVSFLASPITAIPAGQLKRLAEKVDKEAEKRELEAEESNEATRVISEQRTTDVAAQGQAPLFSPVGATNQISKIVEIE